MSKPRTRGPATAEAIQNAALDLSLARGYDNVTVEDICAEVGISQRTFFNHFPTKDHVILGRDRLEIDEPAARKFILSSGPLLIEAMSLITQNAPNLGHPRMNDRMKVIGSSSALLARQMQRVSAIEEELVEVISLRIGHQVPGATEQQVADQSRMVYHLLSGAMRFVSTCDSHADDIEQYLVHARKVLADVLELSTVQKDPAESA
ncbi:TetR/AcrR family transcriptional regulator [Scrofimicrobium sp. R131]|uniref:TetR/AcrR family transcriptional regulator n=1 Tax=Scrofimicrobium appendicitidis TaxID=3079930 RepID=A0AAU7V7K8_9ACTO